MSVWRFIKYNNAVPITFSVLLLSFGTTLAASPEIRSEVASSMLTTTSTVRSVDNTYIAQKDLSTYTPRVEIVGVSEDADFYYVAYRLSTIDLKDSVWQDVVKDETLKVAKNALESSGLGFFATRELRQRVDRERALLIEVQGIERRVVTQRVVATTYSGLIGTFIDDRTEVSPPYTPPSSTPEPVVATEVVAVPQTTSPRDGPGAPQLQILGNNPAQLSLGDVYNDLGVLVTDDSGADLGYKTFLDDVEVLQIRIPPTTHATYTVRYEARDASGNVGTATRTVIVGHGTPQPAPVGEDPSAPAAQASSTNTAN